MRICPQCKQRTEARQCPECNVTTVAETVLTGEDLVGRVFADRYEVLSCIGRGGMGAVYRARNLALGSDVALKVLHREGAESLESIERFHREARAASRLTHPNTIRVFDFGNSEDGRLFIVMEYLDGRSLRAELNDAGRMDEHRILRITEQVCKSLGEAHDAGLVHRDIKPENIFLTRMYGETDFVKVLDFGIARTTEAGTLTKTGVVVGTPKYMSPEQASGRKVDGRSDLYALGVVMYEMFTGGAPFVADTSIRILMMHIQDPPPPLSSRFQGRVSAGFERLVMSLLAKDPEARPKDAQEVLARIASLRETSHAEHASGQPPRVSSVDAETPRLAEPISAPGEKTLVLPSEPETTPASKATPASETPPRPDRTPPATETLPLEPHGSGGVPWSRRYRSFGMIGVLLVAVGIAGTLAGFWPDASLLWDRIHSRILSVWSDFSNAPRSIPTANERPRTDSDSEVTAGTAAVAKVRLSSDPAGARVVLLPNGIDLGTAPVDVFVPVGGSAQFRLDKKGFRATVVSLTYEEALQTPDRTIPLPRR